MFVTQYKRSKYPFIKRIERIASVCRDFRMENTSMGNKRRRLDGALNLEPGEDVVKLSVLSLTGETLLTLDAVTSMLTHFSPKMRRLKPKAPNVDMPSTLCLALTPLLLSLNPLWKISAILLLTNLSIILLRALMVGGHMSLNLFLTAFYVLV